MPSPIAYTTVRAGVYTPSNVTSPITWSGGVPGQGVPTADAMIMPQIEIWNNATSGATQYFDCFVTVIDKATGATVGTTNGQGSVAGQGGVTIWQPTAAIKITQANLWHLVDAPNKPALYTVQVTLVVSGVPADWQNVTTGIRNATFDAATGGYCTCTWLCVCVCMWQLPLLEADTLCLACVRCD